MAAAPLLDSLYQLLTPQLLASAALHLKEPPEETGKGFKASFAGVLAAITELAAKRDGPARLDALLKTPGISPQLLDSVASATSGTGNAATVLEGLGATTRVALFGSVAPAVGNAVAASAGLGRPAGESLLTLSTPIMLAVLAAHQARHGLSVAQLAAQLKAQRTATLAAVPAVLAEAIDVATASSIAPPTSVGWYVVPPAFVLAIVLMLRGCGSEAPKPPPPPPAAAMAPAVAAPEPAPAEAAPPAARLFFAVDKADKWVEGGESLSVLVAWLQSHAAAKVAISGYHDPSGNREHNQELAKARAFVVRDALVAGGIGADRIALEKPVETTGSGDPREARRVEVTIVP